MSHRYGSQMLPSQIDNEIFLKLNAEINQNDLKYVYKSESFELAVENVLTHCYKEDENVVPSLYRILEIDKIVPGFDYEVRKLIKFLSS